MKRYIIFSLVVLAAVFAINTKTNWASYKNCTNGPFGEIALGTNGLSTKISFPPGTLKKDYSDETYYSKFHMTIAINDIGPAPKPELSIGNKVKGRPYIFSLSYGFRYRDIFNTGPYGRLSIFGTIVGTDINIGWKSTSGEQDGYVALQKFIPNVGADIEFMPGPLTILIGYGYETFGKNDTLHYFSSKKYFYYTSVSLDLWKVAIRVDHQKNMWISREISSIGAAYLVNNENGRTEIGVRYLNRNEIGNKEMGHGVELFLKFGCR